MTSTLQAPTPAETPVVRFGVFQLHLESAELYRNGVSVRLRLQAFKVLAALVERPGEVVSREELRERLWGETFVDFDQGLNSCIKEIRAALGDSSETPLYVETLPRRGYRFIAPIDRAIDVPTMPVPVVLPAPPPTSRLTRPAAWGALLLVAAAAVLAVRGMSRAPQPRDWQRVTFQRGAVMAARFAPGGTVVYAAAWSADGPRIYAVVPGAPDARPLAEDAVALVGVSRRGEVAYLSGAGPRRVLSRVPLGGGPAKEILEGVLAADLAPDGESFAVARLEAGRIRLEYPVGHALGPVNAPSDLRISPDGRFLALVEALRAREERGRVVVFDQRGRRVAFSGVYASLRGLAWSPDGREVWFTASARGRDNTLRAVDLTSEERVLLPTTGRLVLHDVAADGRMLMERSALRNEVTWAGPAGTRELAWLDGTVPVALTGVGQVVLQESGEGGGPDFGVYLRGTDGDAAPVRLGSGRVGGVTADAAAVMVVPVQDPDHLELLPIGAGEKRELRHPGIVQYEWGTPLADRRVFFVGGAMGQNMRAWIADGEGAPRPLTADGAVVPPHLVAPAAGRFVTGCQPAGSCIYTFDGAAPQPIPGDGDWVPLALEADGRGLLVRPANARYPVAIERLDLATGARMPWHEVSPADPAGAQPLRHLVPAADGKSYVFGYERRLSELYVVPSAR